MTEIFIGKSNNFDEKLTGISSQFFSALDDYTKYYVYYNKNPEVDEFQNYYANSKGQLQTLSREVFLTTNSIDKIIEELDAEMAEIGVKLEEEKEKNKQLLKLLKNLENTQNGSELLIDDSKSDYNQQYYYNWEIIIGVLIAGISIVKIFRDKNTSPSI